MASWEDLGDEVLEATDVAYEQELQQNPFSVKLWCAYIRAKTDAPCKVRWLIYERALKELPGSYKIWHAYLRERVVACSDLCITDPQFEAANNAFVRGLVWMSKMPRIWLEYCEFLMKQKKVTRTRRALDGAIRALPITQHSRIWELYVKFIKEGDVPQETALCAFRRYLMLEPDHVEVFIAYLRSIGRYDEAATRLAAVVDDEDFSSIEGKTRHQLWMDLTDLVSKHPAEIKTLKIESIIRGGIRQFTDEVGRLWISLGDHFIRLGQFEKARDVYDEAMNTVTTVHDFSLVFDACTKFLESLVTAHMEREEASLEVDLLLARLEDLLARRPELLSSVKLRQNPHNVHEWLQRVKLYKENPEKAIATFTEAVMTVEPTKAEGRLFVLWAAFAKFYEAHGDNENARIIFEKATKVNYRAVDDLASVWCEWTEMELRHREYDKALQVVRQGVGQRRMAALKLDKESVQARIYKSTKLWSLNVDLEESLGTTASTRAAYDATLELKVATPALVLNYAKFLEERKYFEDAFKVYERGIKAFNWPHVGDIWLTYLTRFVERYGGRKLERARDLFEQALEKCPPRFAKRLCMLYSQLEEDYGLARHALAIYSRATKAVEEKDMYTMYSLLLKKTAELFGQTRTRQIYEECIECLPQERIKDACIRYARMETMLGEVDRARGIYVHAAQFCDPRKEDDFWKAWRNFEVQHGNEDTFREMLRLKRSVQATYANVHFNTTEVAAEMANAEVLDPMQAAEQALQAADNKRKISEFGAGAKRQKLSPEASAVFRKESLGRFEPAERFAGPRRGFAFKLGAKGVGYYEDCDLGELERREEAALNEERRAARAASGEAEANPEEIDLDLDLDDGDDAVEGPSNRPAASSAPAGNAEEIMIDLDDIAEAPVPADVFGSRLQVERDRVAEATAEERAAAAAKAEAAGEVYVEPEDRPGGRGKGGGALARFARGKGGKGKGGGRGVDN